MCVPFLSMSSLSPDRTSLQEQAQQLVEELNNKRKQDTSLLEDFKKALDANV